MPLYTLARFQIRPEAAAAAQQAMFDHTSAVRRDLPDIMVTIYRDPERPTHYTALVRANAVTAEVAYREVLSAAVGAHIDGEIAFEHSELVTSSDLQRRHR